MSKCKKVLNPCKICLGPVTCKNGLQCQGACESWVHFTCLNYTPGKIKDIKAGIIKVTCPCPDCKTSVPKEYRTDIPYSCNNSACPANRPPQCENMQCPVNNGSGRSMACEPPPCPLSKCGNDCKKYSSPNLTPIGGCISQQTTPPPCSPHPQRANNGGYRGMSPSSSGMSARCPPVHEKCPSGCSSHQGDYDVYHAVGNVPSFTVVEQMCNTVGQLTNQINDLMLKMKQAVKDRPAPRGPALGCCPRSPKSTCQKTGPKDMCPKPCYCPGNPAVPK